MPSTERREADSSNGKKFRPEDEASYYLGDKFELGGVQFGNSGEAEEKQRNLTRFGEEVWNESDHLGVASTQLSPDDQSVFEKVKMKLAEQKVLDATEVS